ncbi:hypothetical protein MJO28_001523 [Puccinia striiformis f. sp. tritici]|uniref:Translation initiation factor IF-2, chloroplastic n=2 Tax=Puccinia striiformis f. sp. tritici TaxID=168172 RepID=A0A0L0UWY9_9BASI|nr:hypothetical protein MJO28_001523 [Puccinia striiformis f. sp. tritici]KNE91553.1 hypothetical protein PSTG_15006 [Puccinia striiformis f. sp. tritici PST-78]
MKSSSRRAIINQLNRFTTTTRITEKQKQYQQQHYQQPQQQQQHYYQQQNHHHHQQQQQNYQAQNYQQQNYQQQNYQQQNHQQHNYQQQNYQQQNYHNQHHQIPAHYNQQQAQYQCSQQQQHQHNERRALNINKFQQEPINKNQINSSTTATTNQQLLKKRKDEEKKLRRIGVLPTFIKPKNKSSQTVVISKLAQEKKLKKLAATQEQSTSTPSSSKIPIIKDKNSKRELAIPSAITVSQLAQLTHQKLYRLQSLMQAAGLMDTRADRILSTDDTAYLVLESGYEPIVNENLAYDIYPDPVPETEVERSKLPLRPPVVCIMGHVDHGKTSLLDALRKTSVVDTEAGGITQHIGAFEVSLKDLMKNMNEEEISSPGKGAPQTITFLDTPGHAAFSAMRSRGAMTTDVVVLVVAADDGVKPQTKEVIELVKQTDIGIVVAITKCDKPGIDLHRTRAGIYDAGIEVEGLGGEVPCVEVSSITGKGLAELAETILVVAEVRDLRAETEGVRFEGRVIESDVERGHGNMASVITLRGNLQVGLDIIAGRSYGRVRQLIDVTGQSISELSPGRPVRITGWKNLPEAGSLVLGVESEELAKRAYENRVRRFEELGLVEQIDSVNEKRAHARELFETGKAEVEGMTRRERMAHLRERNQQATIQAKIDSRQEEESPDCLNIVLKADFTGTVEAVKTAIEGLGNHQVKVKIVSSGVGNITESDARMAIASGAILVGFNVKIDPMAFAPIETHKVKYNIESIIYRLVDKITNDLVSLLPKRFKERVIGEAKILQVFEINSSSGSGNNRIKSKVAGCKVANGEIKRACLIKILRNKELIWKGKIKDLKQGKKESNGVIKGQEFGISFKESINTNQVVNSSNELTTNTTTTTPGQVFDQFEVNDEIIAIEEVAIERTLNDGL